MLEICNLKLNYSSFKLDIDNLKIKIGDFVILIGSNGSGKTSFLRSVSKLINTESRISFNNLDINLMNTKEFSKNFVYVSGNINYTDISVLDYLSFGRFPYSSILSKYSDNDKQIILNYMKKFNLEQFKDRQISSLSSGEQQRINIAKAFIQDPKVFLLDEPTSNMDIKYKKVISSYISQYFMASSNKIFIIATHEPDYFINTIKGPKILLIDNGKVVDYFTYEKEKYDNYLKKFF